MGRKELLLHLELLKTALEQHVVSCVVVVYSDSESEAGLAVSAVHQRQTEEEDWESSVILSGILELSSTQDGRNSSSLCTFPSVESLSLREIGSYYGPFTDLP